MIYDLRNALDVLRLQSRLRKIEKAISEGKPMVLELTERTSRTMPQNSYLHLILQYFAAEAGLTTEYVKRYMFKATVNPHIFVRTRHDEILHRDVKVLRSTRELSREEMSEAIDRFLDWSAREADILLPEASHTDALIECEKFIDNNKKQIQDYGTETQREYGQNSVRHRR